MSKYNNHALTNQDGFEALIGSPDESRFSDISFPSHVSGLESFVDMEETLNRVTMGNDELSAAAGGESEIEVKNSMSDFLKISSPPGSTSNSTSLNESSSMSLTKLEALQGQINDSFLNSHSDDSEREKNMKQFLEGAISSEKMNSKLGSALSDIIEQSEKSFHASNGQESRVGAIGSTPNQSDYKLNQTQLDSMFLKEVRNRLQLSSLDNTQFSSVHDAIHETLKEIEQTKSHDEETKALQNDIGEELSREIQKVEEEFDRSNFGHVERPNLDGSSSDSDVDIQPAVSGGVSNFARTGIQTTRYGNRHFNMQQELEEINLEHIPERQLAEGIDNVSAVFGDGGGGGDGSSGHSDTDMGGDGGVAIRSARLSLAIGSENYSSDDNGDGRTTPPSRERPVGGSGPSNVASTAQRQVHFSNIPRLSSHTSVVSSDSHTSTGQNTVASTNETEVTPQDSRLSARYFLAASTPFKALDQSETAASRNWMNQTSIQTPSAVSSLQHNIEERTLVGAGEFTMDTPSTMTLSRLRQQHNDADWPTFASLHNEDLASGNSPGMRTQSFSTQQDRTSVTFNINQTNEIELASCPKPYNPFDTHNDDDSDDEDGSSMVDFMAIKGGLDSPLKDGQFKDLEAMFNEDERVIAMNNNTMFKDNDETGISEWSVRTQNQQINSLFMPSEMSADDDDGRVSVYFKTKSKELGKLSGDGSVRPKFSDDSEEVVTPPAALPMPLVKDGNSAEHDQTIPMDVFTSIDNKTFTSTTNPFNIDTLETPKSTLNKTHKRNSNTLSQQKQKRQILGEDFLTVPSQLPRDSSVQHQQQQQHRNDLQMSTEEISTKPTVSVPSSKLEATLLLNDIRERRVSTIGLSDHQMDSMAKLIATMTGTDESLVYQLIRLLPKNKTKSLSNEGVRLLSNASHTSCSIPFSSNNNNSLTTITAPCHSNNNNSLTTITAPCHSDRTRNSNYTSTSSIQKVTPYTNQLGLMKPISSVIPINSERNGSFIQRTEMYRNNSYPTANNSSNNKQHDYLQSTRIQDRYSDPIFDRLPADQRLAASVSPVWSGHPYGQNIHYGPFNYMESRSNNNHNDFQSLRGHILANFPPNISNGQFMPLTTHPSSTYRSNVDSTFFQNPMQMSDDRGQLTNNTMSRLPNPQNIHSTTTTTASSFGSVSDHDSIIHADSVSFPKNINFEVCCVGTSKNQIFQLRNTNRCWIQCQLHVAFLAFNGRQMDHRCNEIFSLPPKATIEPQSIEEIKIRFQPDFAGTYMLKLEFLITSLIPNETNLRWQRLPYVMNIDGIAEVPNVELIFNDKKFIDFGEMTYGSCRKRELKLLNKGRADVPVQLHIISNSGSSSTVEDDSGLLFRICSLPSTTESSSAIDYDLTNNSNTNTKTTSSTKRTIIVPGHKQSGFPMKPKHITLLFQAPKSHHEIELESIMSPASEYTKQLLLETNTKNAVRIGDVFMKAVVGLSRLHSLRTMQAISFNTIVGQQVSRIIPLRNAGNITLLLQPKIIGATNNFNISPDTLSIKPGTESEVKVTFTSNHSVVTESRLYVTLLPDGEQYEWCLRGTCSSIPTPVEEKPSLLCNKLALNWSGVAIGHYKQQKLVLRNSSEYKTVELSMSIHNDHPNFEIQRSMMLQEKGLNRFEAVLKPQSELPVYVAMKPSCFASVNTCLVLRVVNGTTKYVIPLAGYGGCSTLDINGAKKLNEQFTIEMGQIYLGKEKNIDIMLRNSGSRSSFVCMKCFSDVTSKIEYPSTHVTITPNNFVLLEKTSCQITITYKPLKEHAMKSQTFTPAHLAIYSGDEVLRKEFRRHRQKTKCKKPYSSNTLHLLPITSDFMNETTINESVSFTVGDWESFFLSAINRNLVALVVTQSQAEKLKEDDLVVRSDLVPVYSNEKHHQQLLKSSGELWTVTPQVLLLHCNDISSSGCFKLKLINYSTEDLPFVIEPSANTLVITPSRDKVPALSEVGIRVDAKPSLLGKTKENFAWDGYLFVQCNGDKKVVHVHLQGSTQNVVPVATKNEDFISTSTDSQLKEYTEPISRNTQPGTTQQVTTQQKRESKTGTWSVSPRNIVLNPNKSAPAYKLQIVNHTNKELQFEFIWPAETLVITPSKEKIPANGWLGIRVDAKHSFLSRQEDYSWTGSVYIQCDGEQKSIDIKIVNPSLTIKQPQQQQQQRQYPQQETNTKESSATLMATTHDLSLEPHHHISHSMNECAVVTPQVLEFDDTTANHCVRSCFTVKNTSNLPGQWNLLSICPSYFKSLNGNSTMSRVTYPVFQFSKHSGNVNVHQAIKLPVSFHPKDYGMYSQFWDLEISYGDTFKSTKVRLELIGKGRYEGDQNQRDENTINKQIANKETGKASQSVNNHVRTNSERSHQSTEISGAVPKSDVTALASNRTGHVFIKDDTLEFPETEVGKTSEMKFRLCNDSLEMQKVRVSGFRSPFSVILKHIRLSIRPKSYIRVPVYFKPIASETSSVGILILTPEHGECLCVKLTGKSL